MAKTDVIACGRCVFWEREKVKGALFGKCRCQSPAPMMNVVAGVVVWPRTRADDWCGDYNGG